MKINFDEVYEERLDQICKDLKREYRKDKRKSRHAVIRLLEERKRLLQMINQIKE